MDKSTISMAIFNSYISLPESNGIWIGLYLLIYLRTKLLKMAIYSELSH